MACRIWALKPEGKRLLEDLDIDVRIISRWVFVRETGWDVIYWIHLAQDRDQWRDLVNTALKFPVP
jgi:hypothetical protein